MDNGPLGVNLVRTNISNLKGLMDNFIVNYRNKEYTYWFNNQSIFVATLVMGGYVLLGLISFYICFMAFASTLSNDA